MKRRVGKKNWGGDTFPENSTGYQPHYILNKYLCSKCLLKHPLEPITTVAEGTAAAHLRQAIINAWPPPFNRLISDWWITATPGDRRNFIRTLVPNSLSNILPSPLPALSSTQIKNHLHTAMKTRRQRLKTILQDVQQWVRDNPIPDLHTIQPYTTENLWKNLFPSTAHQLTTPLNSSFPKLNHPPPLTNTQTKSALVQHAAQSLKQTLSTSTHLHDP